jgi:hypothetical protein
MRTMHDRYLQANVAGLELKAVDKQILAARIRVEMAEMDIKNHQKQIEQAAEFEEYLRAKFSSVELYTWMSGAVKSLCKCLLWPIPAVDETNSKLRRL